MVENTRLQNNFILFLNNHQQNQLAYLISPFFIKEKHTFHYSQVRSFLCFFLKIMIDDVISGQLINPCNFIQTINNQLMKAVIILLAVVALGTSNLCEICIRTTELLQNSLIKITPTFVAQDLVQSVCQRQYESTELCKRVADQLTPLAIRMGYRGILKTGRLCQSFCPKGFYTRLDLSSQINNIINEKPIEVFEYVNEISFETKKIQINKGNTKLMHLTDVHLDLNYTAGSSIVCDFPICCHAEHGFPNTQSSQAPEYGSSKCDTPIKLFDNALNYIKQQMSDVDGVLITGDFSAHNEWEKTPETVLSVRKLVEDKIHQTLNVQLISAPGNNQYLPDHQVDPTEYPQEALKVIDLVNEEGKTLTFISINTLYCDTINLYLIQDQTMPIRQLKTLNNIIKDKENVVLLGHISPTSPSCSEAYSTLFRAVLTTHSSKIKAQFYGHTHLDQYVVNTDPRDNDTATSFGLLAGSFSPLGTNQPRMRIYELTNDFDLINYKDYAFSFQKSSWALNYNFKEYYGLPLDQIINGQSMKQFQHKMSTDTHIREKYSAKASASQASSKYYCQSYDTTDKVLECTGSDLGFKGKVQDMLKLLQGSWGSYGNGVQQK